MAAALPAPSGHRSPTHPSSIVRFRFNYREAQRNTVADDGGGGDADDVMHILQCTRSHVQSRMRERLETLTEAVQNARLRGTNSHDKKRASQGTSRRQLPRSRSRATAHAAMRASCSLLPRVYVFFVSLVSSTSIASNIWTYV